MAREDRIGTLNEDLRRSAATMFLVRWLALPWATFQVLSYEMPYPPGVKGTALAAVAVLAVGNLALSLGQRRVDRLRGQLTIAVLGLALDVIVVSAFVWIYAFDPMTALWAVLYIVPLEGAILFALPGALFTWAVITVVYTIREAWGSARYDYPFLVNSISFRMGIAFLIALAAGLMARDLVRQRRRAESALDELRRVDQVRSGLVSTLAHDVRSPLTVVRGAFQVLLSRRIDPAKSKQLLEAADRQAERLERLSTSLLDLARLEQGRLELTLEEVPVRLLIDASRSFVDHGDDIQVRIDPNLTVHADVQRMEQIFVNLMSNALKYGAPPVVVDATPRDGHVDIAISDRGPGIPESDRAGLFEPFATKSGAGSIGLGLVIVKALVEAHDGRVRFEPNEPNGSRFIVSLRVGVPDVEADHGTDDRSSRSVRRAQPLRRLERNVPAREAGISPEEETLEDKPRGARR